jgi:neutral ceramidase
MRKFIKFVLVLVFLLALAGIALITPISRKPYTETLHFKAWEQQDIPVQVDSGAYSVGWSKVNITPDFSVPLAGFGKRKGRHFESVHDSIYVRAFAVSAGGRTVYLLSADLLFVPPKVVEKLVERGVNMRDVHFAATHSHSSIGGWESSITGRLFGGKYDPRVVDFLADRFYQALGQAKDSLAPGEITYREAIDAEDVRWRMNTDDGVKDLEVRALTFTKATGQKAHLVTYSAHSTTLGDRNSQLSRDYSGVLVDSLQPDFGAYMAGAVAGMGPVERGETEFDEARNMGESVLSHFWQGKEKKLEEGLVSEWIKVPLPKPTARISSNLGLRPWVFKWAFGDYEAHIKVTKIGQVLLIGMPADFSGEIMVELDAYAKQRNLDLVITSFNGGYIGYITHDKRYDSGHYEALTMSWYGYQVGGYFTHIVKDIIDKLK